MHELIQNAQNAQTASLLIRERWCLASRSFCAQPVTPPAAPVAERKSSAFPTRSPNHLGGLAAIRSLFLPRRSRASPLGDKLYRVLILQALPECSAAGLPHRATFQKRKCRFGQKPKRRGLSRIRPGSGEPDPTARGQAFRSSCVLPDGEVRGAFEIARVRYAQLPRACRHAGL